MPDLNFVDVFKKPLMETTKPMAYNLRVDSRGQEKWRKINENVGFFIFFCLLLVLFLFCFCYSFSA